MKLLDIIKLHHDAVHKENVLVVVFNHERGITRSNVWVRLLPLDPQRRK